MRYAFAPRLEAVASPLLRASVTDSYAGFSNRRLWDLPLGAHCTFGQ